MTRTAVAEHEAEARIAEARAKREPGEAEQIRREQEMATRPMPTLAEDELALRNGDVLEPAPRFLAKLTRRAQVIR